MQTDTVHFENDRGYRLAARLDQPDERDAATFIIFAHCFTCTKNLKAIKWLGRTLTDAGYGMLRFDFTGLGESEGEFASSGFSANVGDLVSAAQWLETEHGEAAVLLGHSLGGAAVLAAAARIEPVKAVATIAAPADPSHVKKLFADHLDEIESQGEAEVELAGRPFKIGKSFVQDLEQWSLTDELPDIDAALLVMHSPTDSTVAIDNAEMIFKAAKHPKSFISLAGADHLLTQEKDAAFVARVVAAWVSRYT